jgi:hypothetical protein
MQDIIITSQKKKNVRQIAETYVQGRRTGWRFRGNWSDTCLHSIFLVIDMVSKKENCLSLQGPKPQMVTLSATDFIDSYTSLED